jgi:hypothetical protein
MRADVEPGARGVTVAMQDQRFGLPVDGRIDGGQATIGEIAERGEDRASARFRTSRTAV